MSKLFRYKEMIRPPGGGIAKTPMLPVTLLGAGSFDTLALIDSGADLSVIPEEIAQILDLDLSATPDRTFGIGGSAPCIDSKMKVRIDMDHTFYTITVPVKVVLGDKGHHLPIILGRDGFFDAFEITFLQKQMKFKLKRC